MISLLKILNELEINKPQSLFFNNYTNKLIPY